MNRILFICHGNICRSTMAEFVMKDLVAKSGRQAEFFIDSKATSTEEIGNPPHPGTVSKMRQVGIPMNPHRASQMKKSDYDDFDLIIGMDSWNIRNILKITGGDSEGKVHMLLDYTSHPRDIADPWYTHNFDETYNDVLEGCEALLETLD
ncbi:MAG: low molecular weight phosphotyrosine protein phosphatase [Treponema sp.]|nr:low molecular weight phosphotyrosine protein phosphatase [Candidatus Treponema equi]